MSFKIKAPYRIDPVSIHQVPFTPDNQQDDSGLVAKANDNGTIIMNKNIPQDSELYKNAKSHEGNHLLAMMNNKLSYDENFVYEDMDGKGPKKHSRSSFQESDKTLAWEAPAYKDGDNHVQHDLRPKPNKLSGPPSMKDETPLAFKVMGSRHDSYKNSAPDKEKISMNEQFAMYAPTKKWGGPSLKDGDPPVTGSDGEPGPSGNSLQDQADAKAKKEAQANMQVVRTEINKVDGGTETIEYLEGEGKGKTFKEAGVDPAKGQAYWDDNPDKYEEYLANKKLYDQNRTFVPDDKPDIEITTSEPPKPKYKPKAKDYVAGKGDTVYAPPSKQRFMELSKLLTGKADSFGTKNLSKKEAKKSKDEYDAKVMESRANKGIMGAKSLTTAEQEAKGVDVINKRGGGKSSIADVGSNEELKKGEMFVKDGQGNMLIVNPKKGTSRPASPKNDIKTKSTNITKRLVNASTLDGRDTTV